MRVSDPHSALAHQPVSFDQVMDFSVIEKLGKDEKYSKQKDEYRVQVVPRTVTEIRGAESEILTNTIFIRFAPNSWDLYKKVPKTVDGKSVEELYDPNAELVLEEVAKLAGLPGLQVTASSSSSRRSSITIRRSSRGSCRNPTAPARSVAGLRSASRLC